MLTFNIVKVAGTGCNAFVLSLCYYSFYIIFRLFCFLWCDGLFGFLQARLATQGGLCSHQLPQDPRKTGWNSPKTFLFETCSPKSSAQVLNAPIIFTGLIGSMAVGHWLYKRGMRTWKTWVSPDTKSTFTNLTKFLLCSKQSTGQPLWPSPP